MSPIGFTVNTVLKCVGKSAKNNRKVCKKTNQQKLAISDLKTSIEQKNHSKLIKCFVLNADYWFNGNAKNDKKASDESRVQSNQTKTNG